MQKRCKTVWLLLQVIFVACGRPPVSPISTLTNTPSLAETTEIEATKSPTPARILTPTPLPLTDTHSPTASASALMSLTTGKIIVEAYGFDGAHDIFLVNPDGSGLTNLTNDPAFATSPDISSDGEWIVFRSGRDGNVELYVMKPDGSNLRRITHSEWNKVHPRVSPDGAVVVFESWRPMSSEICIAYTDSSAESCLTDDEGHNVFPIFSPDGQKIVFVSDQEGSPRIFSMNVDGSAITPLTHGDGLFPAFSPDGTKIAFEAWDEGNREIHIMNADGSDEKRLTFNLNIDHQPTFSPDGSTIAFTRGQSASWSDIYIMKVDGTGKTRLTFTEAMNEFPVFSPDGTKILFWSDRDDDPALYMVDIESGEEMRVTFGIRVFLSFPGYIFDWESIAHTPFAPTVTPTPVPLPPGWCSPSQKMGDDFLVVGYLPDYRDLEPTWGNCLTDLIYFSAEPLPNGELDTSRLNQDTLQTLRDIKERYGTRIHISVGGYRRSENFGPMVTNKQAHETFVENLVEFCTQHNLDGVDLDWEFPESAAEIRNYIVLIKELRERGLIVSVALYPHEETDLQPYIAADRVHIMSYDRGARHATYEQAVKDLELFTNSGIPQSKLILGIPFYGRLVTSPYTSFAYSDIQEEYSPTEDSDEVEGIYFNGMATVKRKTCYAIKSGYGGIMFWELGQDSKDETSLLRAAHHAVLNGCVPWRVCPINCIRE